MPNSDEWDAFADSDDEEEEPKKETKKADGGKADAKDDSSSEDDWENDSDDDKPKGGAGGFDDEDDDGEKFKDKAKVETNWDDESSEEAKQEDPTKGQPKEREATAKDKYGKRAKEAKRKAREQRLKEQAEKRKREAAEDAKNNEGKPTQDRYTEDNRQLFGGDESGWRDLTIEFRKRPLGFSVDPNKRVRKISEELAGKEKLTRGAVLVAINKRDVTRRSKDDCLKELKTITFPLKLTFFNPPVPDATIPEEAYGRLNMKAKRDPNAASEIPQGQVSLAQYPLKCPADFKRFGATVGELVTKSKYCAKGDCVIPMLKEILSLACKRIEPDEIGQIQTHINGIWQTANRKRRGGGRNAKYKKNEEVEANYMNTGEWYSAVVIDHMKGGKYRLKYPEYDDELEDNVPETRIRPAKKKIKKHKYTYEANDFDFLDD